MQSLLTEWEALCSRSPALRFVDIGLRGFGQVMFQDNPLTGILFLAAIAWGSIVAGVPHVLLAGVLGVVASTLTAIWLERRQDGADGRTLRLQRRACRARARNLPRTRRRALDLCRAGRGGLDRGDAWNGERAQAVRGACAHSPICRGHLDHAARDFRLRRSLGRGAAGRRGRGALRAGGARLGWARSLSRGDASLDLAGVSESERRLRASLSCGSRRELRPCRAVRARRRDARGRRRARLRRGKRSRDPGPSRFQPGSDGDRAWRDFPQTEPEDDLIRSARRHLHGRRAGGAQRRSASLRAAGADSAVRSCLMDVLAARRAVPRTVQNRTEAVVMPSGRPRRRDRRGSRSRL